MLRVFVSSVASVAITVVLLLHATHHGAHATSPTHCGYWTEREAELLCRSCSKKSALCGFHVHRGLGELFNGVDASIS